MIQSSDFLVLGQKCDLLDFVRFLETFFEKSSDLLLDAFGHRQIFHHYRIVREGSVSLVVVVCQLLYVVPHEYQHCEMEHE